MINLKTNNWIKLYRELQENPLWQDKPYAKGQAWIDLLLLANHDEKEFLIGSTIEKIERGSLITSELRLMERWGWSKNKLRRFLEFLQKEKMIEKNTNKKRTAINIVNYSVYQDFQTTKEPHENHKRTTERPQKDYERTTEVPPTIYEQGCNNGNNENNDKNTSYIHKNPSGNMPSSQFSLVPITFVGCHKIVFLSLTVIYNPQYLAPLHLLPNTPPADIFLNVSIA